MAVFIQQEMYRKVGFSSIYFFDCSLLKKMQHKNCDVWIQRIYLNENDCFYSARDV